MKHCHIFLILIITISCQLQKDKPADTLFTKLPASKTGINFTNELELKEDFDVFRYRNYYNGGGVALGDINNDGLADIYLRLNQPETAISVTEWNKQVWPNRSDNFLIAAEGYRQLGAEQAAQEELDKFFLR